MHSGRTLRQGARPELVRDILGHANIDVTQNVYGKCWWEEQVDADADPAVGRCSRKNRWPLFGERGGRSIRRRINQRKQKADPTKSGEGF
jgi:hypothetical protein